MQSRRHRSLSRMNGHDPKTAQLYRARQIRQWEHDHSPCSPYLQIAQVLATVADQHKFEPPLAIPGITKIATWHNPPRRALGWGHCLSRYVTHQAKAVCCLPPLRTFEPGVLMMRTIVCVCCRPIRKAAPTTKPRRLRLTQRPGRRN
jgi:hypothetical protein